MQYESGPKRAARVRDKIQLFEQKCSAKGSGQNQDHTQNPVSTKAIKTTNIDDDNASNIHTKVNKDKQMDPNARQSLCDRPNNVSSLEIKPAAPVHIKMPIFPPPIKMRPKTESDRRSKYQEERNTIYEDYELPKQKPQTPAPSNNLDKNEILIQQNKLGNTESELQSEIKSKPLWRGRDYLKQLSTEELISNFYIIEKLRRSYIEQIEETAQHDAAALNSDEHDIEIFRGKETPGSLEDAEFGLSDLHEDEDSYIVEAYNTAGNELVISRLQFDHQDRGQNASAADDSAFCVENGEYMNNGSQRSFLYSHASSERSRQSSTAEESSSETNKRDSQYSDDSSQNSIYMSLKDCLSGVPLLNDTSFDKTFLSKFTDESEKGRNLKIQIDVALDEDDEITHQRHTFYDHNSNARIEKLSVVSDDARRFVPTEKKDYLVEEIVSTEEKYLSDLEKVVKQYIPYMQKINLPEHLKGRQEILFGNIEDIYEESKKFLEALRCCHYDHENIAKTFIKFKNLFQLYPLYSKNKPRADKYIPDFKPYAKGKQEELGDRLDLGSYLLTPIQRLGKYILFLKSINEELNKKFLPSSYVQAALDVVKEAMRRGNDYIAIDSIKNCPINLSKEGGAFVMREKFNVLRPNRFESMVFLFEEIIVFTMENHKNTEAFAYIDNIRLTDLSIITSETEPLIVRLKNYSKCKRNPRMEDRYTFTLEAKSPKIKQLWTDNIEKRLWEQLNKWKEQVKAQYGDMETVVSKRETKKKQQKLERATTLPERTVRRRKAKASTFYINLK